MGLVAGPLGTRGRRPGRVALAQRVGPQRLGGGRGGARLVAIGHGLLGPCNASAAVPAGGLGLGLGGADPLVGQGHRVGGQRLGRLRLGQRGLDRLGTLRPYPLQLRAVARAATALRSSASRRASSRSASTAESWAAVSARMEMS